MTPERRAYIEVMMDIASDFSDGAFWGFMEEKGIDSDEIVEVSEAIQAERESTDD